MVTLSSNAWLRKNSAYDYPSLAGRIQERMEQMHPAEPRLIEQRATAN